MTQAARSGKQNIVEAVGESDTTKKNEIKLLGYSKGSFKERAILPASQVDAANYLLTLIHMETYLVDKQIKAMIVKFQNEGGFSE